MSVRLYSFIPRFWHHQALSEKHAEEVRLQLEAHAWVLKITGTDYAQSGRFSKNDESSVVSVAVLIGSLVSMLVLGWLNYLVNRGDL